MSNRAIAGSTLWQVASQTVMAMLSIVTVKFVAIGLSKELAGNYHSAYGFLQLFGILADFGLYAVAVREVSAAPDRSEDHDVPDRSQVMGALIILRTLILAASLGLALTLVWMLPAWQGTPLPLGVTVASLVPLFTLLAGIQRTVFQVRHQMHYVFIAEVTQRVVTVVLIGLFILMGTRLSEDEQVYRAFLFIGGIGAFVLFVLSTSFARKLMRVRLEWDWQLLRSLLLRSAPYGIAFFCTALYRQLDVTLIALLRPDFEVQNAYYGFALRIVEMAFLFPTFLLNSTLPTLAERHARKEDTRIFLGKTLFAILLLSTTAFLFAFFWARPVMMLLTTDDYLATALRPGSDTALRLLALPMFLNGIVLFSFYALLTRHAWQPLVTTLALGALFSLGLNLMLIPRYGFVGAGWTSIATHLFLASALFPQSLRMMPLTLPRRLLLQWGLYTLLLATFLALTAPHLTSTPKTVVGSIFALLVIAGIVVGMRIPRSLGMK